MTKEDLLNTLAMEKERETNNQQARCYIRGDVYVSVYGELAETKMSIHSQQHFLGTDF